MEAVMKAMPKFADAEDAMYAVVQAVMAVVKADPTEANKARFKAVYAAWLEFGKAGSAIRTALED